MQVQTLFERREQADATEGVGLACPRARNEIPATPATTYEVPWASAHNPRFVDSTTPNVLRRPPARLAKVDSISRNCFAPRRSSTNGKTASAIQGDSEQASASPTGGNHTRAGSTVRPEFVCAADGLSRHTARGDGAGPSFGPPKSIKMRQERPCLDHRSPQVLDHASPGPVIVVGTVVLREKPTVHAVAQQFADEFESVVASAGMVTMM